MAISTIKKLWINLYIITFFISSFDIIFEENFPLPSLSKILSYSDEIFVIIVILTTICLHKVKLKNKNFLYSLIGFSLCGFTGVIYHGNSLLVSLLGWFNTCKFPILFWCFTQVKFPVKAILTIIRKICSIFYVVLFSYILDLFIPDFRKDIGICAQAIEIRMDLRAIGGLFNRFTNATLYANIFYLYYNYYRKSNKLKRFFPILMIFFSLKVKDILGFSASFFTKVFKKIDIKRTIPIFVLIYISFLSYMILMPEHYNEYFNDNENKSARTVLTVTSLVIAKDNFPFGVGHGYFASPISKQYKSEVYAKYGIDGVYGLNLYDKNDGGLFMYDVFYPMLLGETGILGTIFYIMMLIYAFSPFIKRYFNSTSNKSVIFVSFLFISYLIAAIGKPVFSGPPHALVIWGFAGLFFNSIDDKEWKNI